MPSVDFSRAACTTSAFGYVPTTVPLIAQLTLSPFTESAISCVTGWPLSAALCTASLVPPPRPFNWNAPVGGPPRAGAASGGGGGGGGGTGPNPRTMNVPFPYAAQYT